MYIEETSEPGRVNAAIRSFPGCEKADDKNDKRFKTSAASIIAIVYSQMVGRDPTPPPKHPIHSLFSNNLEFTEMFGERGKWEEYEKVALQPVSSSGEPFDFYLVESDAKRARDGQKSSSDYDPQHDHKLTKFPSLSQPISVKQAMFAFLKYVDSILGKDESSLFSLEKITNTRYPMVPTNTQPSISGQKPISRKSSASSISKQ
jgi:hypothetical protein